MVLGFLSRVLQDYAKSIMHNQLESVPEEKEGVPETLPTPPSLVQEDEKAGSPTEDKTSLPPLKTQNKPSVEVILKKIKQQVTILDKHFCSKCLFAHFYSWFP